VDVSWVAHDVDAPRAAVLDLTDELLDDGRPSVLRLQGRSRVSRPRCQRIWLTSRSARRWSE
jgi:hypothetical protein